MRIGLFLFPESRDPACDAQTINETLYDARMAEELGADAVFLAEHHFDGTCAYVDPPAFAAALARETKRIRIGFAVLQASLYHPLRLAEQLSLIDNLCEGRLIVGLGRGSNVNTHEYDAYEVDASESQARYEELDQILIKCWTQSRVMHKGRFWNFEIPMLRPRPFSRPYPQILRAAGSNASMVIPATLGQPMLYPPKSDAEIAAMSAFFASTMEGAGFDTETVDGALEQSWVWRQVLIAPTDQEAFEVGMPYLRAGQAYRASISEIFRDRLKQRQLGDAIPSGVLCGSPETIVSQIKEFGRTGIGGLVLRFRHGPMPHELAARNFQLFMGHVAPHLREIDAARPKAEAVARYTARKPHAIPG